MKAKRAIQLYQELESMGIGIWLDGGWGVDALLEEQTREHEDLDIVVEKKNLNELNKYLFSKGFTKVDRDDSRAWNYVLGNEKGELVDIHVIVFDEKGNGIYGPKENEEFYPAYAFKATGKIKDQIMKCLSAEYQVVSRTEYKVSEKDFKDVSALCKRFNLQLPDCYMKFKKNK